MAALLKKLTGGFLPFGRGDGYVAFDIGSSSIKMVEAAVDKDGYRLLNVGILPLPSGAVHNNMVVETQPVVEAIQRLIGENGVKANKVISAVPGRAVIMKKIQMPRQGDDELEANVEFEAKNVIPEQLENVNLDYEVLNFLDGGAKMEVLLVAVKKEIVYSYTEAIEAAGLVPAIMDVDYFAMENMYEANYPAEEENGIIGLIQIGARYTSVMLIQNGLPTFTGDLPTGGEEFTEDLRRGLNLSPEAAETFKVTGLLGGKQGPELAATLKPLGENLADEIRRTVSLYGTIGSDDADGIRAVYLSGGSAKVPGLCSVLEERLGVPIRLVEPFRSVRLHKNIDRAQLAELAPQLAVGVGLAIRRPGDK